MKAKDAILPVKERELVIQVLYSWAFTSKEKKEKEEESFLFSLMAQLFKKREKEIESCVERMRKIWEERAWCEELIASLPHSFPLLHRVERVIVWQATFEMYHEIGKGGLSKEIIISEALRLCKKFGSNHSLPLINRLLEELWKEVHKREERVAS